MIAAWLGRRITAQKIQAKAEEASVAKRVFCHVERSETSSYFYPHGFEAIPKLSTAFIFNGPFSGSDVAGFFASLRMTIVLTFALRQFIAA